MSIIHDFDIFQKICTFKKKFNVYVDYNEEDEIYDIKLKKLKDCQYFIKEDVMPGKIYLNNNKKGNLIVYKNSKYIMILN